MIPMKRPFGMLCVIILCLILVACGEPCKEGHKWREATCIEAKGCSECGVRDGEALGHTFDEAKITKETFILKRHEKGVLELKDGVNIIKCPNCGASIDATKEKCEYCNTNINYLQEWILVSNR